MVPRDVNKKDKDLAIEGFFRREYRHLYLYVYQFAANADDAMEIVQETFLSFYRLQNNEEVCRCDRALLFRMARNLAIDVLRRARTRESYQKELQEGKIVLLNSPHAMTPEEILLDREQQHSIKLALQKLSKKEQDCLALRRWGLSYQEVAAVLNLNSQSVGQIITRALRKFRGIYVEIVEKKNPAGKAQSARRH